MSRLTDELLYELLEADDAGVYVQAFDVRRRDGDRYDEQRAAHVTIAELAGEVIAARAERDRLREENEALSRGLADMNDGCVELEREVKPIRLALRNVRTLAKRLRKTDPENAAHLLRFCDDAGVRDEFMRAEPSE